MKINWFTRVSLVLCALIMGCAANSTAPTTQPTAAGVTAATAIDKAFATGVTTIDNAYRNGAITKAQFIATGPAVAQARADMIVADNDALTGASSLQADTDLALAEAAQLALLAHPTTKP